MFISRTLLAFGVVALPLTMSAQPLGKVVVTPYVGVYAPTTEIAKASVTDVGVLPFDAQHRLGLALGANASYWLTPRAGFEVGAVYARSSLRVRFAPDQPGFDAFTDSEKADLFLGAAKFMYGLFPPSSDFQLRLGAGPAVITRFGSAYKDEEGKVTGKTDFGGAVSLCTKIPLGGGLALRLRVEDFMYQAKMGWKDNQDPANDFTYPARFQHDVILSVGFQIGLMR